MREDNPATEIMNSLSECINACAMLCAKQSAIQRDDILDAVSWFIEAAPLNELPAVPSFGISKDMIRSGAAVAAKMQPEVVAWNGISDPPPSLVSLAHEFLVSLGMEQLIRQLAALEANPRLTIGHAQADVATDLASKAAAAICDGINSLCALLAWNDAGAIEAPPVDGATLRKTMAALEEAMREILVGGRIVCSESRVTEEDCARVLRLEELITEWPSAGALSREAVTLAEACVSALWGGVSWRELIANARR